jgi:hypothetical protein
MLIAQPFARAVGTSAGRSGTVAPRRDPGDASQAAIYCGVPAAMEAFRVAEEAIKRVEAEEAGLAT